MTLKQIKEGINKAKQLLIEIPDKQFDYSQIINTKAECGTTCCVGGWYILNTCFEEYKKVMIHGSREERAKFLPNKLSEYTGLPERSNIFMFLFFAADIKLTLGFIGSSYTLSKKQLLNRYTQLLDLLVEEDIPLILSDNSHNQYLW